jgi:hypothetical protein
VAVIATMHRNDEIFNKDYVAPPIRKRRKDNPTIDLPKEILEGLPKSKSKAKARRLKVTSEFHSNEKAKMMKEIRKLLDTEILEQEMRTEDLRERKKARVFEEVKLNKPNITLITQGPRSPRTATATRCSRRRRCPPCTSTRSPCRISRPTQLRTVTDRAKLNQKSSKT